MDRARAAASRQALRRSLERSWRSKLSSFVVLDFVEAAALLLALCCLQSANIHFWKDRELPARLTSGLLFGITCVIGMSMPITLAEGVFVDPRLVVLSVAGLFGGLLVSGIAFAIGAAYRLWLGGAGALAGTANMLMAVLLGLAYRHLVAQGKARASGPQLIVFGVIVHVCAMALLSLATGLTGGAFAQVLLPMLATMPLATAVLGRQMQDLYRRIEAEDALVRSEARMRAITRAVPDRILVIGEDGRYLEMLSSPQRSWPGQFADPVGKRVHEVLPQRQAELLLAWVRKALDEGETPTIEYPLETDTGQRIFEARAQVMDVPLCGKRAVVTVTRDITERRAAEERIRSLAYFDPLTALPNRQMLLDCLRQAQMVSGRSGHFGALLFIDLDDFKNVNDLHGHPLGDLMLQQAADRLKQLVRASDTVARFGGDEFVILLQDLSTDEEEAAALAAGKGQQVLDCLGKPYALEAHVVRSSGSVGVVMFRGSYGEGELMKWADLSMYAAKGTGKNAVRFFDPALQEAVASRLQLVDEIGQGLQQGEFVLHYQPQFDVDARLVGAEALVRWQHPVRGLLTPPAFLPATERAGLMPALDRRVLSIACDQLARWAAIPALSGLSVSVNISAPQLHQADFVAEVLSILEHNGAPACRLKLELTESALVEDMPKVCACMLALKQHGVRLSLDDFGTGYSSLSYLQQLPLDQLKIDQSFVRGLPLNEGDIAIVHAIAALADTFGFEMLAEGVETEAQRESLVATGCFNFQGYLFGRPVPAAEIERRVEQERDLPVH